MMLYDELIKNLRETDFSDGCPCGAENLCKDNDCLIWQAADAIEELQKQLREEKVDNVNLKGWLAEEHARAEEAKGKNMKYMLAVANQPRWIPVTERLPEKYDRVLVYSKKTRMGRSIDFINADGNWYTTPKVSHWMPLPQPPESDGE